MSAPGHDAHQAAQAPVSRPNTAPVDSGAIGRLSDADMDALACMCSTGMCPFHNEASDGYVEHAVNDLFAIVERIVREHADRALAEVEQRLVERRDACDQTAAYVEGLHDAHEIVRAARQEQDR